MSKRKLAATIRSVTPVSDGFLKVNRYRFATDMHNGGVQVVEREVMERGHAVGVLGYDPLRDEVILISEFRPGCFVAGDEAYTDNVVAGAIGGDETPCDAAVREMKEEAGLELRDPILVHPGAYVSSGGTSEKVALVVGVVDTSQAGGVHGNADECEDILTVVLSRKEFLQRARRAEITDLKTLVVAYWLAEEYQQLSVRPEASEH
jgi:ADP-ribose pyrophosphatase